ncbi:Cupin domain protein [Roseibium album]|nr:Cupin domain protein [Roseibium album]
MSIQKLFPLAIAVLSLSSPVIAQTAETIELTTSPELKWETTPEGVAFAPLEGSRFEESYMAMVRLPAGLVSPVHVKSAAMYGLIVSGEMVHLAQAEIGGAETVLKPGDYYKIPAGSPHMSKCVSDAECVTFLYQDGPFDFLPVGEAPR